MILKWRPSLQYKYNAKQDTDLVPRFMTTDVQFNMWIEVKTEPDFMSV